MDRLLDKVFLIADSNNNISKTTAKLAAKEGAIIVFTGKNINKLVPVISQIKKMADAVQLFNMKLIL